MDEALPSPDGSAPPKIFRMAMLFEGGLAALACVLGAFMATPPWRRVLWRVDDAAWGAAAALPMIVALLVMRQIHRGPVGRLNAVVDELLTPLFARCTILQLALISLVAGIGEELLFRGVLQPVLIDWMGTVIGLGVASVVFGLLHAVTPTYAVLATAVGAYLGWLALVSNNLLGPIFAHALYDFFALVYLTRPTGGNNSIESLHRDASM